jgi:ATP-binding cassette, subfamily B (MDR/TAP), member 1
MPLARVNSCQAEAKANSVASETFGGIRMIAACGAEERITKKYAQWVQDARKHGQFTAPLIALQFGMIVVDPPHLPIASSG